MARRSEGLEELMEALWAMGALLATVTALATGVGLMVAWNSTDWPSWGRGLAVPFLVGSAVSLTLLANSTNLFRDPGPQSDGPDGG